MLGNTALILCVGTTADLSARVVNSAGRQVSVMIVPDTENALRLLQNARLAHATTEDAAERNGAEGYGTEANGVGVNGVAPNAAGVNGIAANAAGVDGAGANGNGPTPRASGELDPARPVASPQPLRFGKLRLDLERRRVDWNSRCIELSARQFDLLAALASDGDRVWSHAELTRRVWQRAYVGDIDAVSSAVKRLRRRLAEVTSELVVRSVRGVGYRLALRESSEQSADRSTSAPESRE